MRRLAIAAIAAASLFGSTAATAHASDAVPGPCATTGAVLNELGIQMVDLYIWPYYVTCRTVG